MFSERHDVDVNARIIRLDALGREWLRDQLHAAVDIKVAIMMHTGLQANRRRHRFVKWIGFTGKQAFVFYACTNDADFEVKML